MKGRFCCFLLLVMSLVPATTSRPFSPNDDDLANAPPQPVTGKNNSNSTSTITLDTKLLSSKKKSINEEEANSKEMSKIGSSPPSCDNKCYGCNPCEAIQVPTTTTRHSHIGIQYANYEPEGWKCKCGPSFYSP